MTLLVVCAMLWMARPVCGASRSSTADREEPPEPTTLRVRADGTDPWDRLRLHVNMSYLQCIHHTARQYRLKAKQPEYFADVDDKPTHWARPTAGTAAGVVPAGAAAPAGSDQPTTPPTPIASTDTTVSSSSSSFTDRNSRNPCGYQRIPHDALYSGIDSLFFVGDSTIMRSYMHVMHASDEDYIQKVASLDDDMLNGSIALSSGRRMPVYFVRMLYASTAALSVEKVFDLATRNSLIVMTLGSHDCSWLVFRRAMPGLRRVFTGNWFQAKKYWRRFVPMMVNYIAMRLRRFEETAPPGAFFTKPVVLFREQYLPNCVHPKYSKYPLITRCPDLLKPIVIPHYRQFLRSMLATINVPTISNDALFPPCFLIDAGHTARFCKRFEMQMFVQAFRETRRLGVDQGYAKTVGPRAEPFQLIVQSHVVWRDLAILTAEVPAGHAGSKREFPHRGQLDAAMAKHWLRGPGGAELRRMLRLFDNPAWVEKELYIPWNDTTKVREGPTVGGRFNPVDFSQPSVVDPYLAPVIPRAVFDPWAATEESPVPEGSDGSPAAGPHAVPPPRASIGFSWVNSIDTDTVSLVAGLVFFAAAGYMILRS